MNKISGHFKYKVIEVTDTFVRGFLDIETTSAIHRSILKEVEKSEPVAGLIGGDSDDDDDELFDDIRQSDIHWLEKSKKAKAYAQQLVNEINHEYFNLKVQRRLPPDTQYTLYQSIDDHYDWHQDRYEDDDTDFKRILSLSICLSPTDFYQGAEFFIKDGNERNVRVFKMHYGEFIIFPSDTEHKVNALREGERESLVIWYGHYV